MADPDKDEKQRSEERVVMPHRGGRSRVLILGALFIVVILVVAVLAVSIFNGGSGKETVTLSGAGATFPMPLILKWANEYYNVSGHKVKVNYGGGGSGAGITQIEDKHVDFAGTDAPLSSADSATYGLVHIPETLGAVVAAYNIQGVATLKLDGPTLAKIFMKNITAWNDPAIAAQNPGTALPSDLITVVVRSDSSGTTFVFSGYLSVVSSEFTQLYGQGKSIAWPNAIGASGNPGVTQTVLTTPNSIGYIELAYAEANDVHFAILKNHDGNFVEASLANTSAAATAASASLPAGDGDWSHVNILNAPGPSSYPITSFTYILVYKELYNTQSKMNKTAAKALVDFLWWAVHNDGQAFSSPLFYAPLPATVVTIDEATLNSITYNGISVR